MPILLGFSGLGVELISFYMETDPAAGDDVFPCAICLAPAEGLAGGEGCGEIVIAQREDCGAGHRLIGDDGVNGMAVEFFAAVEEAQLDEETDLDNLRTDFVDELGGGGGGSAGGEKVIEE